MNTDSILLFTPKQLDLSQLGTGSKNPASTIYQMMLKFNYIKKLLLSSKKGVKSLS